MVRQWTTYSPEQRLPGFEFRDSSSPGLVYLLKLKNLFTYTRAEKEQICSFPKDIREKWNAKGYISILILKVWSLTITKSHCYFLRRYKWSHCIKVEKIRICFSHFITDSVLAKQICSAMTRLSDGFLHTHTHTHTHIYIYIYIYIIFWPRGIVLWNKSHKLTKMRCEI